LVTGELVKKGEESGRIAVIDVAHEALIRHWPLLRQWVDENRDALTKKRTFEENAQEWLEKDKSEDYLLRGAKLSEAIDFHQRYAESISSHQSWAGVCPGEPGSARSSESRSQETQETRTNQDSNRYFILAGNHYFYNFCRN
jgi:hypothetical protein